MRRLLALLLFVAGTAGAQSWPVGPPVMFTGGSSTAGTGNPAVGSLACSTANGCNSPAGAFLISHHLWENSPGATNSGTGASYLLADFATATTDGFFYGAGNNPAPVTVAASPTFATCGAGGANVPKFCTSIQLGTDDSFDTLLCRDSSTFAACSVNGVGTCTSIITGVNDPEMFIVKHQVVNKRCVGGSTVGMLCSVNGDCSGGGATCVAAENGPLYYTPMLVTAYSGCNNSSTNTLTVHGIASPNSSANGTERIAGSDLVTQAAPSGIHMGNYYWRFMAQRLLQATYGSDFIPRNNLFADGDAETTTKCDHWTLTGSPSASAANSYDPTKADGTSGVHGKGCRWTAAGAILATTATITIPQANQWYTARFRILNSVSDGTLTVQAQDQAAGALVSQVQVISHGSVVSIGYGSSVTLQTYQCDGYCTVIFQTYATTGTTGLQYAFGTSLVFGYDDAFVWRSVLPGPTDPYVIPDGAVRTLIAGDSRGVGDVTGALLPADAFDAALPEVSHNGIRPNLGLGVAADSVAGRIVGDFAANGGSSASSVWNFNGHTGGTVDLNPGTFLPIAYRVAQLRRLGAQQVFFLMSINDFTTSVGNFRPNQVARNLMSAFGSTIAAGAQPIWLQEVPINSNSTFSSGGKVSQDDSGTAQSYGKSINTTEVTLMTNGALN